MKLYGIDEQKGEVVEVEVIEESEFYYHIAPVVTGKNSSHPRCEYGFDGTSIKIAKNLAHLSPESVIKAWLKGKEKMMRWAIRDYAMAFRLLKNYGLKP